MYNDDLTHYGVPGMKWGKRKSRPSSSDIKSARTRVKSDMKTKLGPIEDKLNSKFDQYKVEKKTIKSRHKSEMKREIRSAREKRDRGLDALEKVYSKEYDKILKSDDMKLSEKFTRGEKAANVASAVFMTTSIATLGALSYQAKRR